MKRLRAVLALIFMVGSVGGGCWPTPEPTRSPLLTPRALGRKVFFPIIMGGGTAQVGEKGVAMFPGSPCEDVLAVGADWQYGWSPRPAECAGVENVPMVSCWIEAVRLLDESRSGRLGIGGNGGWFMFFNEPDLIYAISPVEGAVWFYRLLPVVGARKIVAPAPSELHPEWLPEFRQAYIDLYGEPPHLDALAVHCYKQSAVLCQELVERYVGWAQEWAEEQGTPIEVWVTEFAFVDVGEACVFIRWMEANPRVTCYAWFTNRMSTTHVSDAPLVDWETGVLTRWGLMYRQE